MILGLTGGIASGKSTVAGMLRSRGIPVIDADLIARQVVEPGQPAYDAIVERFGRDVIGPDGQIDRKKLGAIVFTDEQERLALNAIVHPEVRRDMRRQAEEAVRTGAPLVVMDIPLLYESGLESMVDRVAVVYVPAETQLVRLMHRDGWTEEQAKQRLAAQLPIEEKRKRADYVIDNQGTLADTERQVEELLARLSPELPT